jgi:hypothetical protein
MQPKAQPLVEVVVNRGNAVKNALNIGGGWVG